MTERERHTKIAQALKRTHAEVEVLIETGKELAKESEALLKRSQQLLTLAGEFEAGRYLPKEADAVPDDTSEPAETDAG